MPAWNWTLWASSPYGNNYQFAPDPSDTLNSGPGRGGTVTVQVTGAYPGMVMTFLYGGSQGFGYTGRNLTETVQVWSNPSFYPLPLPNPTPSSAPWGLGTPPPTPYLGGLVRAPGFLPIVSMGPTKTQTKTFTATPTFTVTPTITPDPTQSFTATPTPPIAADHGHFYCYPNPYDRRLRRQLTFRFPSVASATMEVFNLLGRPVAHLSTGDIYPASFPGSGTPGVGPGIGSAAAGGLAVWDGRDDYGEVVAGGLYFVVLKSPGSTQVLKFTILN